jgi:short-subunit dehydrogenase
MYALITGASKGIGKAMAVELAKRKYNLLLIARSGDILKQLAEELSQKYQIQVQYLAIDLSSAKTAEQIKIWCEDNKYDVGILINNAGYGLWGWFEKMPLSDQLNMMQLNMNVLVELTYALLPTLHKTAANSGKKSYLMNISSTTAYQAIPTMSIYAATKSFVLSFTRGLRFELQDTQVSVTCVSPGATDTDFSNRAKMVEGLKATAEKVNMTPESVAVIAINGMFNGSAEVIPGFINAFSAKMTAFTPKSLVEKIAGGIYIKHLDNK